MLLVGGQYPILDERGPIAEIIGAARLRARLPRLLVRLIIGNAENHLDRFPRDDFDALSRSVIGQHRAMLHRLEGLVVA